MQQNAIGQECNPPAHPLSTPSRRCSSSYHTPQLIPSLPARALHSKTQTLRFPLTPPPVGSVATSISPPLVILLLGLGRRSLQHRFGNFWAFRCRFLRLVSGLV